LFHDMCRKQDCIFYFFYFYFFFRFYFRHQIVYYFYLQYSCNIFCVTSLRFVLLYSNSYVLHNLCSFKGLF
jgi:hypothetical protein